jgi:hypothetical protein
MNAQSVLEGACWDDPNAAASVQTSQKLKIKCTEQITDTPN